MLPRQHRLPKHHILPLIKTGRKLFSQGLLFYYSSSSRNTPRFAIVVRKKKGMTAVVRNRIKRRIRTAIMVNIEKSTLLIDAVVMTQTEGKNFSQEQCNGALKEFFHKIS